MSYVTETKRLVKEQFSWTRLPASQKHRALLTFDDGPNPRATRAVLDLLNKFNAKAIFFVVGSRIDRAPHLLQSILQEGHAIGNHSFSHPNGKQLPYSSYVKDLSQCQKLVADLTGTTPTFFRPPLGVFSPTTIVAPRVLGLKSVLWSNDSLDWKLKNEADAKACTDRLLASTTNGKLREIFLFHDDHDYIDGVLEPLLKRLSDIDCDLTSGIEAIS
jgi:peptidoglycan/xylan/chitin deacetylase (PgdA/CDA1 family)